MRGRRCAFSGFKLRDDMIERNYSSHRSREAAGCALASQWVRMDDCDGWGLGGLRRLSYSDALELHRCTRTDRFQLGRDLAHCPSLFQCHQTAFQTHPKRTDMWRRRLQLNRAVAVQGSTAAHESTLIQSLCNSDKFVGQADEVCEGSVHNFLRLGHHLPLRARARTCVRV